MKGKGELMGRGLSRKINKRAGKRMSKKVGGCGRSYGDEWVVNMVKIHYMKFSRN